MSFSPIIISGALAGGGAGAVLLFLAHVAPLVGAGNFIEALDEAPTIGKALSQRERNMIGILIHMCVSVLFGGVFGWCVVRGWFSGFTFASLMVWSLVQWLFTCVVVMPFEGHGFFGRHHDSWFFLDSAVMAMAWGGVFWGISGLWVV